LTEWTRRALFLVECLDLPAAADAEGAAWEPFQLAHLNDNTVLRLETKARQIAWSFITAAEAMASALLDGDSTIFVSINQEEAKEKIRYAKRVYRHLQVNGKSRIVTDNELGLELSNGARLLSLPSKPPRGKAKMHIVLDELAHVQQDRAIYRAALPVIARGGRLRIGSSPLGATGMFWEVALEQLATYSGYRRVKTPWWKVRSFCKGGVLPDEEETAELDTAVRVDRYGNERIKLLFENMLLEDFQQEFECLFSDETIAWITWDQIKNNQDPDLLTWSARTVDGAYECVRKMRDSLSQIEGVFVGGADVGRKRNLTEIILLGIGAVLPVRLMISLDQCRYDDQEKIIRHVVQALPVAGFLIDQNGIGNQLAEALSYDTVAEGVTFTNQSKALWAVEARIQLERGKVPLPVDRELAYQVHSIKRKTTEAKNVVFDTERNEKHHADKFWALALAIWAARDYRDRPAWGQGPQWER